MKKTLIIMFSLVVATVIVAQSPHIEFEKRIHDFGKIYEKDGRASVKFVFKNIGDAPLVVTRVQASCGCTTPSWTREPIMPGDSGHISVSYNPYRRPGSFAKSILVHHNADTKPFNLTIKGSVVPKSIVEN